MTKRPNEPKQPMRVVHIDREPYDVYIGRRNRKRGLEESPFHNPFPMKNEADREKVIKKFEEYIRANPELMKKAKAELPGKVLGCYCAPKPCHGDVLIKIVQEELKTEKNLISADLRF